MAIQGLFASHQGIVGERATDLSHAVLMTNPSGMALLFAMTSGMASAPATDTVFSWFEDSHASGRTNCVSGGTGTTVVVGDGSFYTPNTILLVQDTGEHMLVTATSGNSLTVIRGLSGSSVTSITSAMFVQKIGTGFEEGAGRPTAVTQQGAPRLNYVQIFRNGWAITGTAKAITFVTGSKLARNKALAAMYHAEDIERSFLYGRKTITTLNNKQFRLTDGILTQIEQYGGVIKTAASDGGSGAVAGQLSRTDFQEFIRQLFSKQVKDQPNERIAMCGDWALKVINDMPFLDGMYQFNAGETKLGIKVTEVMTPFGTLKMITHPMMNENPIWQKEVYAIHPGGIRKRPLRPTFEEGYDQNGNRFNGQDADEGVITTETGIECAGAQTMGIYRNINKAVKSV